MIWQNGSNEGKEASMSTLGGIRTTSSGFPVKEIAVKTSTRLYDSMLE